ncbi:MAG: MFS transporter [Promethearchaeota archaeon]
MLKSSKSKEIDSKITPDFVPMIRIVFWNSLGFFFFTFLIPYVTAQLLEASGTEMGLTFASQTLGGLISTPIVGYLTDKVSKKFLVLIGSFGRAACYILMYLGIILSSLIIFAIGLFILGFFAGFFWSPLNALISEKSHKTFRSSAFGKQGGMLGKGNLVGSIVSFFIFGIANYFVPSNLFLVYSPLILFTISNIYAGIIFHKNVNEKLTFDIHFNQTNSTKEKKIEETRIDLKRDSDTISPKLSLVFVFGFIILITAFMTSSANQTIAPPFFQVYLINELKVTDPTMVMIIYFPSQIISLLLSPRMGRLADKIKPQIAIAFISGFGALVTLLIVNSSSGLIFGIILTFDVTLAWASSLVLQNVLSRISKGHRGKIFGMTQWMSFFGAIIGPIVGGLAWDHLGPQSPFIISIFIELSVIPLYITAIKLLKPYMAEKIEEK